MNKLVVSLISILILVSVSGCGHLKKPFKDNPGKGNHTIPVDVK